MKKFIISTQYKAIETDDVVIASELLKGLVAQLGAHPGVEVALWAWDYWMLIDIVRMAGLEKPEEMGHVAPYEGSYQRGFKSTWK